MESQFSDEFLWASALSARLRVLQSNFADDSPATRQGFIVEEIERALKGFVPEKRKAFLGSLAVRFPSWQATASPSDAHSSAPTPETPEILLERLLKEVPRLTPQERADFTSKLARAGLVPETSSPSNIEVSPELLKRLGMPSDQPFNPLRAGKGLTLLLDMVLTIDQLVWTLWKQIATKSAVRREVDLAKLSGPYLTGSGEVSTTQMTQALERTRKMVAGLLGAVGRAGGAYARERARLFDPVAIEADARSEKKWNESLEFACWRKYVQLCKEYGTEPVIEKGIQEAVAKAAENLITGRAPN